MKPPPITVLTPEEVREIASESAHLAATMAVEHVGRQIRELSELAQAARGLFTQQQLCEYLNVSEDTIRRYRKQGLRCYRIGRDPLYLVEDVVAFVRQHPDASEAD